jgi:uncharacterized damage-inducible protein DinB
MSAELIGRYAAGSELLEYAAQGINDEQAHARPGPGAWSLAELFAHMADSDVVGADRIKRVLAEPEPTLLAYDENAWIDRLASDAMPIADSVALFVASRRFVTRILERCTPDDLRRAGTHTETGRKTLADLLSGYVNHLDHHLRFLYAKRANLGIALYPRYSHD